MMPCGRVSVFDYIDKICSICCDSSDFRVLKCGHAYCLLCIEALSSHYSGVAICPLDRERDPTPPRSMPKPENYKGKKLLYIPDFCGDKQDLDTMLSSVIRRRLSTVKDLKAIAVELHKIHRQCTAAKLAGAATGLVGSGMLIAGIALTMSGVGSVAGLPILATGLSVTCISSATTAGTLLVEVILKRIRLKASRQHIVKDRFLCEKIRILMTRSHLEKLPLMTNEAQRMSPRDITTITSLFPRVTGMGAALTLSFSLGVKQLLPVVAQFSLQIGGLITAGILIPIDSLQAMCCIIDLIKGCPYDLSYQLLQVANTLDAQLKSFVVSSNLFQLLICKDKRNFSHWLYIIIDPVFEFMLPTIKSCKYEDIVMIGYVVKQGLGDVVPVDIVDEIHDGWFEQAISQCV